MPTDTKRSRFQTYINKPKAIGNVLSPSYIVVDLLLLALNFGMAVFGYFDLFTDKEELEDIEYLSIALGTSVSASAAYFAFLLLFNRLVRHTIANGRDPIASLRESVHAILEENALAIYLEQQLQIPPELSTNQIDESSYQTTITISGHHSVDEDLQTNIVLRNRLLGLQAAAPKLQLWKSWIPWGLGFLLGTINSAALAANIKTILRFVGSAPSLLVVVPVSSLITLVLISYNIYYLLVYYSNVFGLGDIQSSLRHIVDIQDKTLELLSRHRFYKNFYDKDNISFVNHKPLLDYLISSHPAINQQIIRCINHKIRNEKNPEKAVDFVQTIKIHLSAVLQQYIASQFNYILYQATIPISISDAQLFDPSNSAVVSLIQRQTTVASLYSENTPLINHHPIARKHKVWDAKNKICCATDSLIGLFVFSYATHIWFQVFNIAFEHRWLHFLIPVLVALLPALLQGLHYFHSLWYWSKNENREAAFTKTNQLLEITGQKQQQLLPMYHDLERGKAKFIKNCFNWGNIINELTEKTKQNENPLAPQKNKSDSPEETLLHLSSQPKPKPFQKPPSRWWEQNKTLRNVSSFFRGILSKEQVTAPNPIGSNLFNKDEIATDTIFS